MEAPFQRPRPGHKRNGGPAFQQGLKGGPRAGGIPLAVRAGRGQRLSPPGSALPALEEGLQHGVPSTPAWWLLLRGSRRVHRLCGRERGPWPPLRRRDLDCHRTPGGPRVPKGPDIPLEVAFPPVRRKRAHDGVLRPLHGKAPPGLADEGGGIGGVPVGRLAGRPVPPGGLGALDVLHPVDLVEGPGRSAGGGLLPGVCAPLGWRPRRRARFAQVAAHAERRGWAVTSSPLSAGGRRRWPNPSIRGSSDGWATGARNARGGQGAGDTRASATVSARPGIRRGLSAVPAFSGATWAELNRARCPGPGQHPAPALEAHPSACQFPTL